MHLATVSINMYLISNNLNYDKDNNNFTVLMCIPNDNKYVCDMKTKKKISI